MLDGVRKTLGRLPLIASKRAPPASQYPSGDSGDHLTYMNIPALVARQDAAYEKAVALLGGDLFSMSEQSRCEIYGSVLKLLDIALQSSFAIPSLPHQQEKGERQSNPIHQYLMLLKDTVQAAYALVTHEMILFQEEKQLSDFIGNEVSTQFRSTDEIFSDSEMNISHCVNDLIEMAQPAIARHKERTQKAFQKSDIERYEKSFKEFSALYKAIGNATQETPKAVK